MDGANPKAQSAVKDARSEMERVRKAAADMARDAQALAGQHKKMLEQLEHESQTARKL